MPSVALSCSGWPRCSEGAFGNVSHAARCTGWRWRELRGVEVLDVERGAGLEAALLQHLRPELVEVAQEWVLSHFFLPRSVPVLEAFNTVPEALQHIRHGAAEHNHRANACHAPLGIIGGRVFRSQLRRSQRVPGLLKDQRGVVSHVRSVALRVSRALVTLRLGRPQPGSAGGSDRPLSRIRSGIALYRRVRWQAPALLRIPVAVPQEALLTQGFRAL
jgi:hypothetical protein